MFLSQKQDKIDAFTLTGTFSFDYLARFRSAILSVTQDNDESITFTQMVVGKPVDSKISKDIIIEIYKVVGNYRRQ